MKLTLVFSATALLIADTTTAFRIPPIIEPRQQQQQPSCSLYSGFKDSPSFTSFCKQLPRATRPVVGAASSSTKSIPSISTKYYTFDGGVASTLSPIAPFNPSGAPGRTFVMQNYTVAPSGMGTTSSKPAPTDLEVNCYINGSKVPMSECTRTPGLTKQHGYTYSHNTTSSGPAPTDVQVNCYISGSKVPMSECTRTAGLTKQHGYTYSDTLTASSKPASSQLITTSSAKPACTSNPDPYSKSASRVNNGTTSAPVTAAGTAASGSLTATCCTNTMNLTRLHGYTYPDTLVTAASTATIISSGVPSNSANATSSAAAATSSSLSLSASFSSNVTSFRPSGSGSYGCGNITGAEPHRTGSTFSPAGTSGIPSNPANMTSSTAAATGGSALSSFSGNATAPLMATGTGSTLSTSFVNSYDCSNITGAEPHRMNSTSSHAQTLYLSTVPASSAASTSSTAPSSLVTTSLITKAGFVYMQQQTSTTTVVDATVTTIVPCATDIGQPAEQKRDESFMAATVGGICDAGVYCVNSTFVSDAPPSWHWDAVALKQGQTCLEDNVFNTPWVEQQCACAGL